MKIKLYESWGVLAHEKQPVYTVNCPVSDAYNLVEVELPHVTGANDYGEPLLTLDGSQYLLHEVLTNWGDKPALVWYDVQSTRRIMLDATKIAD